MTTRRPRTSADPMRRLLDGYAPQPGVADEMMDAAGQLRPGWEGFLRQLAKMAPGKQAAAFARGDRYLRDAGVYYRHYAETGGDERDWPLSHIPVIIHDSDWATVERGLVQRAELLERVARDLYGPGRLVREGYLPAQLVAGNPEWLRPLVGITPRGGYHLHFLAFEIGRSPDGSWFVLGDRTQAPSGAGFALENRVAASRVFADQFQQGNIHRLAGFFRAFRDSLNGLREGDGARVGILTPGPHNDTYFEHAYIARYLGLMLLEGEDLVVQDGRVMVRTVEGPRPIDVLWRRLDARFADPLELDPASRIGTPGLVAAIRERRVTLVNALGSGVLETRAFMAFLPRLAEVLLNEPLILPNIATWWCGQPAEQAHVIAHAEEMVFSPALSNRLPFDLDLARVPAGGFRPGEHPDLASWIAAEGAGLVGQESVSVSTAPVWEDGRLAPRPMSLRAFALRTPGGWQIMPGGFARVGRSVDAQAIALQRGGTSADVWIVSDNPVPPDTMIGATGAAPRGEGIVLPSRAADNLFWMGRYVERTEHAVRLLRAYHLRIAEGGPDGGGPLLGRLRRDLTEVGLSTGTGWPADLRARIAAARACAGNVRDRFSLDGWAALGDLEAAARDIPADSAGDEAARVLGGLLKRIAAFSGLVHENMYRFAGWRFLALGRAIERAESMAMTLQTFAAPDGPDGALDLAVEVGDSVMTHRRRYAVATNRATVIDLLALDEDNPRSVLWQLADMRTQIDRLPGNATGGAPTPLVRAALRLYADLATCTPAEVTGDRLAALRAGLAGLSDRIGTRYFG